MQIEKPFRCSKEVIHIVSKNLSRMLNFSAAAVAAFSDEPKPKRNKYETKITFIPIGFFFHRMNVSLKTISQWFFHAKYYAY